MREIDDPSKAAIATFNMTPMIDVVFQLIVVFLCSMKFRTLDQKIDAALPHGGFENRTCEHPAEMHPVLGVRLLREGPGEPTRVVLQGRSLGSSAEGEPLWERFRAAVAAVRARAPDLRAEIDASPEVEHGEVVHALDAFVAAGVAVVQFRGTRPPRPR